MGTILLIGGICFLIWLLLDNSKKKTEEINRQKEAVKQRQELEEIEAAERKIEVQKKIARQRQRQRQELEEIEAAERKIEVQKKLKTTILPDILKNTFKELGTSYATDLESAFNADKRNFGYLKIRQLSIDHQRTLSNDEKSGLYNELERGVAILETCEQLKYYHFAFGKKHKKKLDLAFRSLQLSSSEQAIEIIDYGCGQALASVMFIDFCKENNININIDRVVLLEPSNAALKRGVLNINLSLKSIDSQAKIYSVNKKMNNVLLEDIKTDNKSLKIHMFSNIIDLDDVNIEYLAQKIKKTQNGKNIFVCVSPNFYDDGTHWRNKKIISFYAKFDGDIILHTFSDIGYIVVFRTGFSGESTVNKNDFADDLPF